MKRLSLILLGMTFVPCLLLAQDHIVLKDGREIEAKVKLILNGSIRYVNWDNQDGPERELLKGDILFIRYQNGEKEMFSDDKPSSSTYKPSNSTSSGRSETRYQANKRIRFNAHFSFGADFTAFQGGPTLDIVLGVRFTDYFFLGFETGFHIMMGEHFFPELVGHKYGDYVDDGIHGGPGDELYSFPFAMNMRGYIPVNKNIKPFINLSLGGYLEVSGHWGEHLRGFYCNVGAGIEIKRFNVGMGFTHFGGIAKAGGYAKLGIRVGK